MEKVISITMKELSRYEVLQKLIKKEINGIEAAKSLCLSVRQVRRLKNKVKKHGAVGLTHGNRGKPSNRKTNSDKENEAIT